MFGSKKRARAKKALALEFKQDANETQNEIDFAKTANPLESAASKSAITRVNRNSSELQNRISNMLGSGASAEALISATGKANEASAAAMGNIAAGSEANKNAEINRLRALKESQMGNYAGTKVDQIDETGSGWNTLFQGIGALGNVASGISGAAGSFI